MKAKRIFIFVLLVVLLISFIFRRCAKAEEYPVPTFDIPEPSVTDVPLPEPVVEEGSPPPIVQSPPYNNSIQWRQYEWIKVKGTPGSYLYTYDGSVGSTAPYFKTMDWSQNMLIGTSLNKQNANVAIFRGGYTYDFQLNYRAEQVPYGMALSFFFQDSKFWYDSVLSTSDGQEISIDMAVDVSVRVTYSDNTVDTKTASFHAEDIIDGISLSYPNESESDIRLCQISLTYKAITNGISVPEATKDYLSRIYSSSTLKFSENVLPTPETVEQKSFFETLTGTLGNLFVPSEEQFKEWLQKLIDSNDMGGFTMPHELYINLLTKFSNVGKVEPPTLEIPPLTIHIDGQDYQFFDGYTFDFADLPQNIFVYSRMAGSIFFVGLFVKYLWNVFRKLFGQTTSSVEEL